MKKLTALFCLAAMVLLLFSGCSDASTSTHGGAASIDLLVEEVYAMGLHNQWLLRGAFVHDCFAPNYKISSGMDEAGNPIIYDTDTLTSTNFFGMDNFVWLDSPEEIGRNTNEAELTAMLQEMYAYTNLDLSLPITEERVLRIQFSATPNTSSGDNTVHYYEQELDIVCIDGQYYILSVTPLSETTESNSDTDTEPEYYTLEQAKEQGGFFVLSEDRFYPLLEAYEANWDGYDYYVTAISDEIPVAGSEGQLVMFGDSGNSTSVTITAASDLGTTIPLALIFHEQLGYCIRDLLFYSNTEPRIAEEVAHLSDAVWNGLHALAENIDENYLGFANENGVVIDNISGIEDISTFEFLELETRGLGFAYSCMLKCDEGEWVTIGYYVGTSYYEFEIPAVARYWATGQSAPYVRQKSYDVEFEKTREGYFVVPLDELPDGVYSIDNYKLFEVG